MLLLSDKHNHSLQYAHATIRPLMQERLPERLVYGGGLSSLGASTVVVFTRGGELYSLVEREESDLQYWQQYTQ